MAELESELRHSGSRVCASKGTCFQHAKFCLFGVQEYVFFQLFLANVMDDPRLVEEIGLLALQSAAVAEEHVQGQGASGLLLDMFARLLELLTLRHRLIEMSMASAHLARSVLGPCGDALCGSRSCLVRYEEL